MNWINLAQIALTSGVVSAIVTGNTGLADFLLGRYYYEVVKRGDDVEKEN